MTTLLLLVFLTISLSGCRRASNLNKEVAYVSAQQANLRDRLAPIYEKKGIVKNGDKLYVLEKKKRFIRVRTERGEEGWIEDRNLIDQPTFDQFNRLSAENQSLAAQAQGVTRAPLNLHITPGRDTDHLYQLKESEKVDILKRSIAEKKTASGETIMVKPAPKEKDSGPQAAMEDWFLVRDSEKRSGWVLARMVDIDVPLDIAQYAEGQRIVASFVLSQVRDDEKSVPQYLVLLTDNKDGLPYDFNQIRVFTWNLKRHRYETAYRERNLEGVFPASASSEDFGSDGGVQPAFTIQTKGQQDRTSERKYRLMGPIVRRVISPEEQARIENERANRSKSRR